jgi:hypothetical protein
MLFIGGGAVVVRKAEVRHKQSIAQATQKVEAKAQPPNFFHILRGRVKLLPRPWPRSSTRGHGLKGLTTFSWLHLDLTLFPRCDSMKFLLLGKINLAYF